MQRVGRGLGRGRRGEAAARVTRGVTVQVACIGWWLRRWPAVRLPVEGRSSPTRGVHVLGRHWGRREVASVHTLYVRDLTIGPEPPTRPPGGIWLRGLQRCPPDRRYRLNAAHCGGAAHSRQLARTTDRRESRDAQRTTRRTRRARPPDTARCVPRRPGPMPVASQRVIRCTTTPMPITTCRAGGRERPGRIQPRPRQGRRWPRSWHRPRARRGRRPTRTPVIVTATTLTRPPATMPWTRPVRRTPPAGWPRTTTARTTSMPATASRCSATSSGSPSP